MSSNTDGDKTQYFRDLITWETEGEITPAQATEAWDEWDEYEEAGPMDLEDQLDRLLEQL